MCVFDNFGENHFKYYINSTVFAGIVFADFVVQRIKNKLTEVLKCNFIVCFIMGLDVFFMFMKICIWYPAGCKKYDDF